MYHTLEKTWEGGTFALPLFIFCPPYPPKLARFLHFEQNFTICPYLPGRFSGSGMRGKAPASSTDPKTKFYCLCAG